MKKTKTPKPTPANHPGTTTVRVTIETREQIAQLAAVMTIDSGKKVEMGHAVAEAVRSLLTAY